MDEADKMLEELGVGGRTPGIAKVRYTHDAMIDLVVQNPAISQNEIGARFGYTASWVSLIFSSDAFQERLTARKTELVDPTIRASIEERLRAVTTRSLDVLLDKLNKPASSVPDNLALRAAELGAKGLGVGGHAPQAPAVDHLEVLAQRLIQLQGKAIGQTVKIIEGETYEPNQNNSYAEVANYTDFDERRPDQLGATS